MLDESLLLVVVDLHDILPVMGDLFQTVISAEVDEVQNVLLETGSSEADACVQEFGADAGVHADGARNLDDIRLGLLAKRGDGVDRRYSLGEEGVGNQLGEFTAPDAGGDDPLPRNPVCIDVRQRLSGLQAAIRVS